MNNYFVRFTPGSIIDLYEVREAIFDETNNALHITYKNGDTFDVPLSDGGQRIWDALDAVSFSIFAG